ncbi:hypothetical protein Tco_0086251 [Tanacetum coccineum]
MSFSKHPDSDAVCYTKPLYSLKRWNDHFFWVDSFACPAFFPWHTGKNVSRDFFPKSTEFIADDYDVLVAYPALFQKFSEPFLCLIGMSRNYTLDEDTYPTFLHDDGTERAEEEAKVLDSTVGRVVPFLLVSPTSTENELRASVERLFDEGGSAEQGDSAAGGGQEAETEIVTRVRIVTDEEEAQASTGDYEASSRVATSGKSQSILKELLARSMLNVKASVVAVATLPMVTSSVSATPKHKSGVPADFITGLNLRTIGASERFVISSDSSHHSATNASRPEDDFIIRSVVIPPMMTETVVTSPVVCIPSDLEIGIKVTPLVHAFMFHDSDSTKTVKADTASPSYSAKQDLLMGSRELNSETLRQVFVLQWNVLNDSLLNDYNVS